MPLTTVNDAKIPSTLYWAMICQFAVGGAVIPFAGLLLRERGLTYAETSQIFAAASVMLLVFPFLWGMVADRFLPIDRLFTVLNSGVLVALAVLYSQMSYNGLLIGFLLFYSLYHPTFTLINALCFHHLESPQTQFGKVRLWGSVGWMIPCLPIAFWLVRRPDAELGFVLSIGAVAALAMVGVTFRLPRTGGAGGAGVVERSEEKGGPTYWEDFGVLIRNGDYVAILVAFFLLSGSFSLLTYYSPPYLVSLGVTRPWVGPIQCIGVVIEIAVFPFLRFWLARGGFRTCLALGAFCLVVRHLLYVVSTSVFWLCLSYVLAGLMVVLFHIGASILVNQLASASVRASAQTLLVLLGSGLGPLVTNAAVAGLLHYSEGDLRWVFLLAAVLAALATGVIWSRGPGLGVRGIASEPLEAAEPR